MAKDFAIVLNNGGVNSAVTTAVAAQRYRPIMVFAETARGIGGRLRAAFDQQVAHFKPYREHTVALPQLASPQAATAATANLDPRLAAPLSPRLLDLLPLISIAVRLAVQHDAVAIYLGMRVGPGADDLAQATEYFQIWNELLEMPCGQSDLEIHTPVLELEPWQVVDVGFNVAAPLERTWSCQEAGSDPCWICTGCRAREAAFQQAAKLDPLRAPRRV